MSRKETILVTGFGPFGEHKINASWECVRLLPTLNVEEEFGVKLVVKEVPVTYKYVSEHIPSFWKELDPMLVVHVGVSSLATGITLESRAHKSGYCRNDVEGDLPPGLECCTGKADVIQPLFNVHNVGKEAEKANIGIPICISSNAGRYLCEYIYYTSLNIDNLRTIFVHVPDLNKFSADQLAKGIKTLVGILIEEIRNSEVEKNAVQCI
ncbi:Pyroglutamyl-peptidase 1 [Blattella germanica]|nr:Pyroglutamyl-peptidase 1 [Blattella germanica]